MARKKHVKKEPDIFQRTFTGAFRQLSGAGLTLAAVLIGLLLLIALLWGFSSSQEEEEQRAWERVGEVLDERDPGKQRELMEEVSEEIKGTRAHPMLLLIFAARLHDDAIRPDTPKSQRAELLKKSRRRSDAFLKAYPEHPLAHKARANLARVLEDAELLEAAFKAFGEAAAACQDTEFSRMQGKLLWGRARCAQKLGRPEDALRILERALAKTGSSETSAWRAAAEHMRDSLRKATKSLIVQGVERDKPPKEEKKPEKPGTEKPEKGKEKPKSAPKGASGAKG